MEDLKAIIKEMIKIREDYLLNNLSDDMLINKAVSIFIHLNISNEKKESRIERATSKQKYFLQKHGVKNIDELTKEDASKIIEDIKKRNIIPTP